MVAKRSARKWTRTTQRISCSQDHVRKVFSNDALVYAILLIILLVGSVFYLFFTQRILQRLIGAIGTGQLLGYFFGGIIFLVITVALFFGARTCALKLFTLWSTKETCAIAKRILNPYVLISFAIMLVVVIAGIGFIEDEYTRFPLYINWYPDSDTNHSMQINQNIVSVSRANCTSVSNGYYTRLVAGDRLLCQGTIIYKNSSDPRRIKRIAVTEYTSNETILESQTFSFLSSNESQYYFYLNLPKDNFVHYSINMEFSNESMYGNTRGDKLYGVYVSLKDILPMQDYQSWQNQKLSWFLALVSISFAAVLSGVNNLRELIQNGHK